MKLIYKIWGYYFWTNFLIFWVKTSRSTLWVQSFRATSLLWPRDYLDLPSISKYKLTLEPWTKVATLSRVHHLYNLQSTMCFQPKIRPFHSAVICRTFVRHSTRGRFHRYWHLTVILLNKFLLNHLKRQDIEQHRSQFLVANQAISWSDDARGSSSC